MVPDYIQTAYNHINSLVSWDTALKIFLLFLGALASYLVRELFEYLKLNRTPHNIFTTWHSTWVPAVNNGDEWVTELLEIKKDFFRGITLKNLNNSKGHTWTGRARLKDKAYLIGDWQSTKHGSNIEGVFTLTFTVNGNALIGSFLTREKNNGKIASGFVLGRTENDMLEARKKLDEYIYFRMPKTIKMPLERIPTKEIEIEYYRNELHQKNHMRLFDDNLQIAKSITLELHHHFKPIANRFLNQWVDYVQSVLNSGENMSGSERLEITSNSRYPVRPCFLGT